MSLSALVACGARTSPDAPAHDGDSAASDAGAASPTCASPPRNERPCGPLRFRISTAESCAIAVTSCDDGVDGEAFQRWECGSSGCTDEERARYEGTRVRVLAMNRCGRGHLVGYCDGTRIAELFRELDLGAYLGRRARPRIGMIGESLTCNGYEPLDRATLLGWTLPDEYLGHPEHLAAEWDVIVVCRGAEWYLRDEELATLSQFVIEHGKGVVLSQDYVSYGIEPRVNAISAPCGFVFQPIAVGWSFAEADLACVPDYPGP